MAQHRDIGIDVKAPAGEWDGDMNCPFYGSLRLRGQVLEGTVSSVGMQKTITIERHNVRYMKKYERFEKRTSVVSAHLPACIGEVNIGDNANKLQANTAITQHVYSCGYSEKQDKFKAGM